MDPGDETEIRNYANKILTFARQHDLGYAYRELADFVWNGLNTRHGANHMAPAREFVWYYVYYANRPTARHALTLPFEVFNIEKNATSRADSGRLIFLRGYPSPEWVASLGQLYQVHPEYWRRHLNFLFPSGTAIPQEHRLPSVSDNIFQIRVGSIGRWGRWWKADSHIGELRRTAAVEMERYTTRLRQGTGWTQGDSVVRGYTLHDKDHFSIEQNLTVYLQKSNSVSGWVSKFRDAFGLLLLDITHQLTKKKVIVFQDSADDLLTSPKGPWLGIGNENHPKMLPTPRHTFNWISNDISMHGQESSSHGSPPSNPKLHQSLSQICQDYGGSILAADVVNCPFYLLKDIFQEDASNEGYMLDLIAEKIKKLDIESQSANYDVSRSQLLHFHKFLQYRIENMQDKLYIIRRRGGTSWPREQTTGNALAVTSSLTALEQDFEYLLESAHVLLTKIGRTITLTMNLASIEESRRGISLNTVLFRFTVVASFYIPLSFTTSFFGMNVKELGTGTPGIWVFFVVALPVLALSIVSLIARPLWAERIYLRWGQQHSLSASETRTRSE